MAQKRFHSLPQKLKEARQTFLQICRNDVPGLLAARTYAQHFRDILSKAFEQEQISRDSWSLVAVGGFGRGELSFVSDLDILFLYRGRLPESLQEVLRDLVYGLWDSGFEVGHVTASPPTLKRLMNEDFSALTTYLETQFIAGNRSFYDEWRENLLTRFGRQNRTKFLKNLSEYRQGRLQQYGESSYLLEPHVKEGVGGLRDLQLVRWAGVVFLQKPDLDTLMEEGWLTPQERLWVDSAYDFLWRVRLQLHQLTGRRQDQLLFPEQESIALRLGFMSGSQGSAVEAFMRLYYRHTARIRRTTSFFLERLEESQRKLSRKYQRSRVLPGPFLLEGHHLHFMEPEWIRKDPRILMQFFWQAVQSDAHFHHQAGQIIRENLQLFNDQARRDPEVVRQFLDILLHEEKAFTALKVMLETGFLDVFLPEFAQVRYRVQHDVYHLYTVDEHLLRTVWQLHRMEQGQDETLAALKLPEVFQKLQNRKVLYLAALLHDIGKGQGKDHSAHGAGMVPAIAERLGLSSEETDLLQFLIQTHLLLAETALKRDLMDEKPILRCAVSVEDTERLDLLYLLTIADSRATGPGAWNTWKASLLRELWVKVHRLLARGEWKGEDLKRRSEEISNKVLSLVDDPGEKSRVGSWLDRLSFRYLLSQRPEDMVLHYRMEKELNAAPLSLQAKEAEGTMWQVTLATRDRPGLFSLITGVLWARGLNILSADIFTRESGIALDILLVEKIPDPLRADELWGKVRDDLISSLRDPEHLEKILEGRKKPSLLKAKDVPRKEDRVVINEEASDFYTIIEVYTWDRPGILHHITRTLFQLEITIQLAKISTPGAQVADVFYVTDLSGNKLLDAELHRRVRERLFECLSVF